MKKHAPKEASFEQVLSKQHSKHVLLHPSRPVMIYDRGFEIVVEDLPRSGTKPQSLTLSLPFAGKTICIESLTLTRDGCYLMVVVKTKDQCFSNFEFHIVMFDMQLYQCKCNSIIPGVF